jgi:pimeloyl-ACP methyl ester carboxylesterase
LAEFFDECPGPQHAFERPGLHVHRRDNQSRTLVVFVHGWGGSGYGTWRGVPAAVYNAEDGADVALFDYVSGWRRALTESPALDAPVESLVDELQALTSTYSQFLLVGHSMGGVVAAAVLRRSHEVDYAVHVHAIGVLSIASPRAGIRRIPFAARPIKDSGFLAVHQDVHSRNFEFFTNLVDVEPHVGSTKRLHIPHCVAIAAYDRIVNRMTASSDLPRAQSDTFQADHSKILDRPDVEKWVCDHLAEFKAISNKEQRLLASGGQRTLVARFNGHALHGEWQDAYKDALIEFGAERRVLVRDDTIDLTSDSVGLMVRVMRCEDVGTQDINDELMDYVARQASSEIVGLGLPPSVLMQPPTQTRCLGWSETRATAGSRASVPPER